MKLKPLIVLFVANILTCASAHAETDSPSTETLSLDAVLREVLTQNPSLRALQANAEGMAARVPQARAWEDPRAGVDVERYGSTRFFDWTANEWMISQAIPINGKNRQRARAASAEAGAARADVRQKELELAVRARTAYARLANARAQIEISRGLEGLLRQLIEVSRSKYATGMAMQSDSLMAESDLVKLLESRRDLERRISDEQSQLNVLMNRLPQAPLPAPLPNVFVDVPLNVDELQTAALECRPDLQSIRSRITAAEARVDLAKRAWIPDPEIRVEARQLRDGTGFINEYDTGIFINLPWFNQSKYRSAITEAQKGRETIEFELEASRAQVLGTVRDQVKKIETLHHHYTLFRDRLVPLARRAAESASLGYVNGKGQFLDVITALRSVRDVAALHQDHLTDYLIALSELEAVVGQPLSAVKTVTNPN